MNMDKLLALGFSANFGQIDKDNVNYGTFNADGPVLTEAGLALVASLEVVAAPKKTRKKVEEVVEVAAEVVVEDVPAAE